MRALYAGSFDPFTIGHYSIAQRALKIFDSLVIGIGINESKRCDLCVEERLKKIQSLFSDDKRVTVIAYEGLTSAVAADNECGVLLRGVRNALEYEKEKELAEINLKVFGIDTVLLTADPSLSFVSSSMVRELSHFHYDVEMFLPKRENK